MKKILQFMLKRKVLPIVLVILYAAIFWAFQTQGGSGTTLTTQQKILTTLGTIIEQNHYKPKPFDDNFSQQIFTKFLAAVDPDKNIFLQSDVNSLKKYQNSIDDEIHGAPLQFVPTVDAIYTKRMQEVMAMYKEILAKPFDFTANEEITVDGTKLNFASTEDQRKDMWRKKIKFLTLERYTELTDQRDKLKSRKDTVATIKTNAELEKEARQKVGKTMDKNFDRLKLKFNDDERFNLFINTITSYMDPH